MIEDIVSNEEAKQFIKNELKRDKESGTYLFYGPDMSLLVEFALSFAKGLSCETLKGDFCDKCSNCNRISRLTYSDLEILEGNVGVDKIRDITYKASISSYEGNKKIFIIKNMSKMKKEAANALLKTIEEPPVGNFFILLSQDLNILPTIKSRSLIVRIKRKTAIELGVDDFTYEFFRGNSEEIEEYKKMDIDLEEGFSYLNIQTPLKEYGKKRNLKDKINVYKGIRDFINSRNFIDEIDKINFAEQIIKATTDREILGDIIAYTVYSMGDMQGLEERLRKKSMLRFPVNIKLFFIEFFRS